VKQDSAPALLDRSVLKWTVRLCAFIAAGLCGWLAWQKLSGVITPIAGCGGSNGCDQVLSGRWSQWMGVPVSFLAFGFYLAVLLLTLGAVQRWLGLQADRLLCAAAVMAVFCAAWFIGLLYFQEKQFCPYCAAAHLLGVAFAIPLLVRAWQLRDEEGRGFFAGVISAAVPGFLILVLGQLFGPRPQTHIISETSLAAPAPESFRKFALRPGEMAFFDGALVYQLNELPRLGSPKAKHVMVEYFDYTCRGCRDMSGDLESLLVKEQERFAVLVLPCPLSKSCNPNLPANFPDHPGACELATLALAVWRQAPSEFPAFHHFLMKLPFPIDLETARQRARELCGGEEVLQKALTDTWIKDRFDAIFDEFRLLSAGDPKMPKLLLQGNRVMHGAARDVETFLEIVNQEFR
jgi:uncharacterized membrane protein